MFLADFGFVHLLAQYNEVELVRVDDSVFRSFLTKVELKVKSFKDGGSEIQCRYFNFLIYKIYFTFV